MSDEIRRQWLEQRAAVQAKVCGFGVTSRERAREHSGLQLLQGIVEGRFPAPPICQVLDYLLIEVAPGTAVFQGHPRAEHYNPLGAVHGGWITTLLDSALGCAVHSTLEAGLGYTTLEVKVNFVRGVTDQTGPLRAEGKVIHPGKTAATAEARLVDVTGRLYAHGTTTCLVFKI